MIMNGRKPQTLTNTRSTTLFERILAILAAVICLFTTGFLWWSVSAVQSIWPLPSLYFVEVAALGILGAYAFIRAGRIEKFITWGVTGALIGFAILGALSVGFFYLPVAMIFAAISITSDLRNHQPLAAHLGVCLLAGLVQGALMLAVIQVLH